MAPPREKLVQDARDSAEVRVLPTDDGRLRGAGAPLLADYALEVVDVLLVEEIRRGGGLLERFPAMAAREVQYALRPSQELERVRPREQLVHQTFRFTSDILGPCPQLYDILFEIGLAFGWIVVLIRDKFPCGAASRMESYAIGLVIDLHRLIRDPYFKLEPT